MKYSTLFSAGRVAGGLLALLFNLSLALAQAPTVTGLSATTGKFGDVVTITGTDFTGATGVRFGGGDLSPGITVNGAGTSLTAYVPANAGSGAVTVTTPTGAGSSSGSGSGLFTALPVVPLMTRLTPSGPLNACGSTTLTASAISPAFNPNGLGASNFVYAVAVQTDGKTLVGGNITTYNNDGSVPDCLLRLNVDGSVDNTFNFSGGSFGGGFNSQVLAVVVQPDGKILVGGQFASYNGLAAAPNYLLRLNADGTLDNTFNYNGTTYGAGFDNFVRTLALQPDGKVLVGGDFITYNGSNDANCPNYVVRLTSTGLLDNTFNNNGTVYGSGGNGNVNALALQADGKVVLGGAFGGYNGNLAAPDRLLRVSSAGLLDNTFNPSGAGLSAATGAVFVNAVAVQVDGAVVVGGQFMSYNGDAGTPDHLMRVTSAGLADNTYNNNGTTYGAGASGAVNAVVLQPDGKALAGGQFLNYNGSSGVLQYMLRLTTAGLPDNTYNNNGTVYGAGFTNYVNALSLLPDGQIMVGGLMQQYNSSIIIPDRIVRVGANGIYVATDVAAPGATFTFSPVAGSGNTLVVGGSPGSYTATATLGTLTSVPSAAVSVLACPVLTGFSPTTAYPGDVVTLTGTNLDGLTGLRFGNGGLSLQLTLVGPTQATAVVPLSAASGPLTVYNAGGAGSSSGGGAGSFTVGLRPLVAARLSPVGPVNMCSGPTLSAAAVDPAFDILNALVGAGFSNAVQTMAVQPDGKIIVGGLFTSYNSLAAAPNYLLRLNADGTLDNTFNYNGTTYGAGFDNAVYAVVLQPDGKILVGGSFLAYNGATDAPNAVLRLNADGSLDTSFNYTAGSTTTGINTTVNALALQPDGRIVVGGSFTGYNGTATPGRLVRLTSTGAIDNTFNYNGTAGNGGLDGTVQSVVVLPDGKILLGGQFTTYNGNPDAPDRLLRLSSTGQLDWGFNTTAGLFGAGINNTVQAVAVQPDGKLVVGGSFTSYNGDASTPDNLLRLTADGLPDNTFNYSGGTYGSGPSSTVNALALQADGKVLIGGNFSTYNGSTDANCPNYVVRLTNGGLLDNTFNNNGSAYGSGTGALVNALALQPDDRVLVGGNATSYNGSTAVPAYLQRLSTTGLVHNTDAALGGASFVFSPGGSTGATLLAPAAGTYTATATVGAVTSLASAPVLVLPCPVLTAFSPSSGYPGDVITLTGTDLGGLSGVRFGSGGLGQNIVVNGAGTSATVQVPVDAATGLLALANLGGAGTGSGSGTGSFTVGVRPTVTARISPIGPVNACNAATLTATAVTPAFNVLNGISGSGFNNTVNAVAVQPDGKIIVGGLFTSYNGNASAPDYLLRLNADGTLDNTFNYSGGVYGSGLSGMVSALALQPDGRVLVGGLFLSYNGATDAPNYLLRLNADGTLDTSFNYTSGSTTTGTNGTINALALQPDGKVLAGGNFVTYNGSSAPHYLIRVSSTGLPDNTFNYNGTAYGIGFSNIVYSLALQPDGRVLVGGVFAGYNNDLGLPDGILRLSSTGLADATFNYTAGAFGGGLSGSGNLVYALALQPDGKVLVGGSFNTYNGATDAPDNLMRLLADGTLDQTYNYTAGSTTTGSNGTVAALAMQPDGKVLVGGSFLSYNAVATTPDNLLRLTGTGQPDNTYNNNGTVYGAGTTAAVYALALQPDGQLLAGNGATSYNGSSLVPDNLLRLTSAGLVNDTDVALSGGTFAYSTGGTGSTLLVAAAGTYTATATVSGVTSLASAPVVVLPCPVLTAFSPASGYAGDVITLTGTDLDGLTGVRFGTGGLGQKIVVSGGGTSATVVVPMDAATGVLTLANPGGAGSNSGSGLNSFTVLVRPNVTARISPPGPVSACGAGTLTATAVSPAFNLLNVQYGAGFNSTVLAVAVQPDGKIIVGGQFTSYNGNASAPDYLLRLNADGTLDNTFNYSGGAYGSGTSGAVYAVAVQPDGKIIVGGLFTSYNGLAAAPDDLLRLNADGTLDNTFNYTSGAYGTGLNGAALALALQPDGKVLVGGSFSQYNGAAISSFLLRLTSAGLPDNTFNYSGTSYLAGFNTSVLSLALQPDGKIVVGGIFASYNGDANAPDAVLRLSSTGAIDATFNYTAGAFGGGLSGTSFSAYALALQPDGKIIVGGLFTGYNGAADAPNNLLRLLADGSLDQTYNYTAGSTTTGTSSIVTTLALQADGNAVVGGSFTSYNGLSAAPDNLLRLTSAGQPDNIFNYTGGTYGSGASNTVQALAWQPDGQLLAGGASTSYNGNSSVPDCLLRLTSAGLANSADAPLSGGSFVFSPGGSTGSTLVPVAAGSITATATVGSVTSLASAPVVVLPCLVITNFTPSSGTAGDVVTITGTNLTGLSGVRFGTGGLGQNIVVSSATSATVQVPLDAASGPLTLYNLGGAGSSSGAGSGSFTYVPRPNVSTRLSPVGPLSACTSQTLTAAAVAPAFNVQNAVAGVGFNASVNAVAVQPDGKIVVGGQFTSYNGDANAPNYILRLNADGTLDNTFNFSSGSYGTGTDALVNAIVLQPNGKIVVGGTFLAYNGATDAPDRVLRLNADGTLDTGFNYTAGSTTTGANNIVLTLALQPDGQILVGGAQTAYNAVAAPPRLMRLTSTGAIDNTFNFSGSTANAGFNTTVYSVAVQPDGKIVVGGAFTLFNNDPNAPDYVLRLTSAGLLDNSFNYTGGTFGAGISGATQVNTVALQADGKVLAGGGFTTYNGDTGAANNLLRLLADGTLDTGFNYTAGSTTTGASGTVYAVLPLPDGKLVLNYVGFSYNNDPNAPDYVLRLTSTGLPDNTFNYNGSAYGSGSGGTMLALAAQPDGQVLVGGLGTSYNGSNSAPDNLVRLTTAGLLNNTDATLSGATYVFSPGGSTGSTATLTTSTAASYTATATVGGVASSASNAVVISVCPPPTLTAISPALELVGLPVTLTGTSFTAGSTVTFGGVPAASVVVNSLTSITAVVPASALAGSSAVVVTANGGSTPGTGGTAFEVLTVYDGTTSTCPATTAYPATGDGLWHYLRASNGQVVAALEDTRAALGTVTVNFQVLGNTAPVRNDGRNHYYLDRNFKINASAPTFTGSTLNVRFYGLNTELAHLTAADPAASLGTLKATQYSGANEDCDLGNNDIYNGQFRTLALSSSTPGNGAPWFVSQATVADHFSEFFLTSSATPLPVELSAFTAEKQGPAVLLNWQTASEKNANRFDIERSTNGKSFEHLGTVVAKGSKGGPTAYAFRDDFATTPLTLTPAYPHTLYYRLRLVDADGTASYSPVRTVTIAASPAQALIIWPNPAHGTAQVQGSAPSALVQVIDALGRVLLTTTATADGSARLALPAGLAAGVYSVRSGTAVCRLVVE